jgi:hypothetical protein
MPKHEKRLFSLWEELSGSPLWDTARKTLTNYMELLTPEEVEEAIITAAERHDTRVNRFRYFCGICRTKLAKKLDPSFKAPWERSVDASQG